MNTVKKIWGPGSGADSMGHGGTCPQLLQMVGHGGAP